MTSPQGVLSTCNIEQTTASATLGDPMLCMSLLYIFQTYKIFGMHNYLRFLIKAKNFLNS